MRYFAIFFLDMGFQLECRYDTLLDYESPWCLTSKCVAGSSKFSGRNTTSSTSSQCNIIVVVAGTSIYQSVILCCDA